MSQEIIREITLKSPITFGGQTYSVLTLKEPDLDQLDQAMKQESKMGLVASLIASVSGIPIAVARKLKSRDIKQCSDFLEAFTEDSPETGEAKSPT